MDSQIKDPLSAPELPQAPARQPLAYPTAAHSSKREKTSWGSIIAIIVIILLLLIGALYFWGAELSEKNNSLPNAETPTGENGATQPTPLQ